MRRSVLVVGANGYIGTSLVSHLVRQNWNVVGSVRKEPNKILKSLSVSNVAFRRWDADSGNCPPSLTKDIAVIVNCLGVPATECKAKPLHAAQVNLVGSLRLMENAVHNGISKWIQISTIHVVSARDGVVPEDSSPSPLDYYSALHTASENGLREAARDSLDYKVLRLSNAFGFPIVGNSQSCSLVVNDLCRQAVFQRDISLKSSGHQFRDFIDMHSVMEAIELTIRQNAVWQYGQLCSGNTVSVRYVAMQIAEIASAILGVQVPIQFKSELPKISDVKPTYSNENLKSLGWRGAGNLNECLEKCILNYLGNEDEFKEVRG